MKACKKCEAIKPLDEFYTLKGMADGRMNSCKPCYRAQVKANRENNAGKYREYDRQRANNPERIAARASYAATDRGRAATSRAKARFIERNPIRRAAHLSVANALRAGHLLKQPCEVCQSIEVHGHHDDYGFPLTVRWLCPRHHAEWHKENEPRFTGCAATAGDTST